MLRATCRVDIRHPFFISSTHGPQVHKADTCSCFCETHLKGSRKVRVEAIGVAGPVGPATVHWALQRLECARTHRVRLEGVREGISTST